jgi:hypothetical protein
VRRGIESPNQVLPPTEGGLFTTQLMTKHHMLDATLAIVMGIGIGFLLSAFGQKMLNKHYQTICHNNLNHNLIYTQGFLGDTYYCMNNAYLK